MTTKGPAPQTGLQSPDTSQSSTAESNRKRWLIGTGVALFVGVLGAAATIATPYLNSNEDGGNASSSDGTSPTPSPSASSSSQSTHPSDTASSATAAPDAAYGWVYLNEHEYASANVGWLEEDVVSSMRGVTYVKSITFGHTYGDTNWVDYNLGLKCQRFEVTVGVDDNAPPKASARVSVWTDNVEHVIGQTALGKPLTAKLDVAGVLRLRLEGVSTVGDGSQEFEGDIVWGSPRSWCTS